MAVADVRADLTTVDDRVDGGNSMTLADPAIGTGAALNSRRPRGDAIAAASRR